ncbi:MAG: hypothetical protein RMJ66_02570 [Bacteroidia bacterium]|nr:hypothetical protein [Bacteroidia bacterium]
MYQDSLWQEGPAYLAPLRKQAKNLHLREAKSQIPIPLAFFEPLKDLYLNKVCDADSVWEWHIQRGQDSLILHSRPPSPKWMAKNFKLLRGPRLWKNGSVPYKEIEIIIPLGPRPQLPEDTLWKKNSKWLEEFVIPWTLYEKNLRVKGRVVGLTLLIYYTIKGEVRYTSVGLLSHAHPQFPYDEQVLIKPLSKIPKPLRSRFDSLRIKEPAYAYIVRIQDYYPTSLQEAWSWTHLFYRRQDFPLPHQIKLYSEPLFGNLP